MHNQVTIHTNEQTNKYVYILIHLNWMLSSTLDDVMYLLSQHKMVYKAIIILVHVVMLLLLYLSFFICKRDNIVIAILSFKIVFCVYHEFKYTLTHLNFLVVAVAVAVVVSFCYILLLFETQHNSNMFINILADIYNCFKFFDVLLRVCMWMCLSVWVCECVCVVWMLCMGFLRNKKMASQQKKRTTTLTCNCQHFFFVHVSLSK